MGWHDPRPLVRAATLADTLREHVVDARSGPELRAWCFALAEDVAAVEAGAKRGALEPALCGATPEMVSEYLATIDRLRAELMAAEATSTSLVALELAVRKLFAAVGLVGPECSLDELVAVAKAQVPG